MSNIPDFLAFGFPLIDLLSNNKLPESPNLSDVGLSKGDISSFINLRRAIGRSSLQRQGAQASRVAAGSLPSSLSQSTVPASIQAGIQTKVGDQIATLEGDLAAQELSAKFKLFDLLQTKFQNEFALAKEKRGKTSDVLETLSFLPLII